MMGNLGSSPRKLLAAGMVVLLLWPTGFAVVAKEQTASQQPSAPIAWKADMTEGLSGADANPTTLAQWWKVLNDPILTQLEEDAVKGSLDVRQAEARVREARARRGTASADRFPTLSFNPSASQSARGNNSNSSFGLGFDSSWEVDLFGSRKNTVKAADASVLASIEDLHDVMVTLLAEVALNYLEVRTFQERLDNAQDNAKIQQETYDIARWRYEAGLTTQRDVEQARLNLEQTNAQIPTLRAGLEQAKNRIAVLLGRQPGTVDQQIGEGEIPVAPVELAVGIPADTLRRRPDVRRAERQVAAQTAQVAVAKADRYPKLALIGSIGLEALSLGGLLSTAARALTGGLNIGQTVFNAGKIRENIAVQNAVQEQAVIAYQSSVLTALQDVEGALVDYAEEQARRRSLQEATDAARNAAELASQQYQAGLADFQVVLDSQRSLLSLEDQLASSTGNIASNLVRVYKALGGGWEK